MEEAVIHYGSLNSGFAANQNWSPFSLGVFAGQSLFKLNRERERGMKVFSYTHKQDSIQDQKIEDTYNDGLFLDWATPPLEYIEDLAAKLHQSSKRLIINSGWGAHERSDYGSADIILIESFLGTHSGEEGPYPASYSRTNEETDLRKLKSLKEAGYEVIVMTYGAADDLEFARRCFSIAESNGADYFVYAQVPMWEKEDSGYTVQSVKA